MESSHRLNNFSKDDNDKSVYDILSKLKFISKIKEGEVVDVRSLTIMEVGMATSAYRTFITKDEGRDNTLKYFRQIISEAFDMITLYLNKKDKFCRQIGIMIYDALVESKPGINSHIKTYSNDRMFVSKIETLIVTLDTELEEIKNIIQKQKIETNKKNS